jgi:uncharacterized SAM-binding protein YcdF (DUF218 family)
MRNAQIASDMFFIDQIVNVLVDPVLMVCLSVATGLLLVRKGWRKFGGVLASGGLAVLFFMSWPPLVDAACAWFETDYPIVRAENYPAADAILVLGGGVGMPSSEVKYPYPTLADAADRVWFGAMLWHAQKKTNASIKVYCTGPEVSRNTPPFLASLGVPVAAVVSLDGPLNTKEEACRYEEVLPGKCVLLVTSALHMKRATRIFRKYAPSLRVIPAPTDHHFFPESDRFSNWNYYLPSLGALSLFSSIQHELIGLFRYAL